MRWLRFARTFAVALSGLCLSLAGCLQDDGGEPTDPGTTSSTQSQTPASSSGTSGPSPLGEVPDDQIQWNDCVGAGLQIVAPQAIYRGNPPHPSWEEDANAPTNAFRVILARCERIAWGQFERGPIFVLLEWDGNLNNPSSCGGGDVQERGALDSIWFSDPELVQFAKDAYQMPAHLGTFTYDSTQGPEGREIRWTWATAGNEPSDTLLVDPQPDQLGDVEAGSRLFWSNGQGVNRMDFWRSYQQDQFEVGATGTMQPPMLWATQGPVKEYAATAGNHAQQSMNATLVRYGDLECKEPL